MTTIFISIPWFDPAYKAGGPVRSVVNLVRALNSDFRFYVFCGDRDVDGEVLEVRKNEWTSYAANVWVWYDDKTDRSKNLEAQVNQIKPQFLYINGLYDWHFSLVPLIFIKGPRKIVAVRGMLHPGALLQKRFKKLPYLAMMKKLGYFKQVTMQAVDEEESVYIRELMGDQCRVEVVPNLATSFQPNFGHQKEEGALQLLSIGLISPMKNYLSVIKALKLVKHTITYRIFGAVKDRVYWDQCLTELEKMPENITVKYEGSLAPVLVDKKLNGADVFILPSESENFGHALGEALSAGVPVITSHQVPWRNLREHKAGMNINPDAHAIAEAIDYFAAMNATEWQQWREGASAYHANSRQDEKTISAYKKLFSIV